MHEWDRDRQVGDWIATWVVLIIAIIATLVGIVVALNDTEKWEQREQLRNNVTTTSIQEESK